MSKKILRLLILTFLTTSCTHIKHIFYLHPQKNPDVVAAASIIPTEKSAIKHSVPSTLTQYDDIVYPLYKNNLLIECENHVQDIKPVLGEPSSVTIEKIPNQHVDSQIDELHELFYDDLSILVYVFEKTYFKDNRNLVVSFTLTGERYSLPNNIGIGSSLTEIRKYLKPFIHTKDFFVYFNTFEGGYQEEVHFYFAKDKLSKVIWNCFMN